MLHSKEVLEFLNNTLVRDAVASQLSRRRESSKRDSKRDSKRASKRDSKRESSSRKQSEPKSPSQSRKKAHQNQKLVFALADESVKTVVMRLSQGHISAMPVFSNESPPVCLGVLDFNDVVAHLLSVNGRGSKPSFSAGEDVLVDGPLFLSRSVANETVGELLARLQHPPELTISLDSTLMDAVVLFGSDTRPRRMLVMSDKGEVLAMLSPGRIFEYLGEVDPTIRVTRTIDGNDSRGKGDVDVFEGTVGALKVGTSPVLTVPDSMPVIEAIRTMHEHGRSIVALVDAGTHALTGSISSSDVKRVVQEHTYSMLNDTCGKFKAKLRSQSLSEDYIFFGCKPTNTLRVVTLRLLATHVHHIYIIDRASRPISIVSFPDIFATILA